MSTNRAAEVTHLTTLSRINPQGWLDTAKMSTRKSSTSSSDTETDKAVESVRPKPHTSRSTAAVDPLELPYETLNDGADMTEFTTETVGGTVLHEVQSNRTGRTERYELVTFTVGDKENPKNWSHGYKWYCTMVVAFTCFVVAFCSAVITADLIGVSEEFGVSDEVSLLTISVRLSGHVSPFSILTGAVVRGWFRCRPYDFRTTQRECWKTPYLCCDLVGRHHLPHSVCSCQEHRYVFKARSFGLLLT